MNEQRRARIEGFYAAFGRLDGEVMQTCYAPDARFDDEVFSLRGAEQIGGMWRMLCDATAAKGMAHWKLEASAITDHSAHWEAHYLFSATGRLVHNRIDAEFEFDEKTDLISRHTDRFDFWAWSRQALGLPGVMLGWSPMLRANVRGQAGKNLQRFLASN